MQARELTTDEAERPLGWHYPEPYATYDAEGPLGRDLGFFAVESEDGDLVGFGCVGAEARVPGVEEEPGTVDVGYGMRPDLIGHGLGREFVGAVLAHVVEGHPDARLRMSLERALAPRRGGARVPHRRPGRRIRRAGAGGAAEFGRRGVPSGLRCSS